MSSADLWEDGYPHGTVEGYLGGCRGGSCPAGLEHGLTCKRAKTLDAGDFRYKRLVREGKTPAEIAALLDEHTHTPPTPAPDREKRHLKALARELDRDFDTKAPHPTTQKETRMPTPADVAHTTKPLHADPVPDLIDEESAQVQSAEQPVDEAPATPSNKFEVFPKPHRTHLLTVEPWVAGLTQRAKTEKVHEIREWLRNNGFPGVGARGTIPQDALAAYAEAFPVDQVEEESSETIAKDPAPEVNELAPAAAAVLDAAVLDAAVWDLPIDLTPTVDVNELKALNAEADGEPDFEPISIGIPMITMPRQVTIGFDVPANVEPVVAADLATAAIRALFAVDGDVSHRSEQLDETRERINEGPDDFRPDWAGVTIPADIRQARSIAARLEEDNAHLLEQLAGKDAEIATMSRSLTLLLRKWAEADERVKAIGDAEEHLDVAAQRIDALEDEIVVLRAAVEARDALNGRLIERLSRPRQAVIFETTNVPPPVAYKPMTNRDVVADTLRALGATPTTDKRSPWWKRGRR